MKESYVKKTAQAAKWIWDRKERSVDWNWPVLTKHNPDPETLGFDDIISFQIFTILERKGLIEPFVFENNGRQISSFKLCLHNEKEWEFIQHPPTGFRKVLHVILWFFGGVWRSILWVLTIFLTALLTLIAEKLLE